ncbi:MAG TPA: hypothetical protein VGV61_07800, partial [Thermoanaerobaculia bacterium]|nr:hypothetical protein [Thermoanaerobaculia bacterium]
MPIPGSRHALPIWLSALLVLSGCGSSLPAAKPARGGAQAGEAAEEAARETTASDGARLQRALERALAAPADLTSLRLAVDCQQGSAMRNMRVFGNGVGILEERSQFRLTRAQLEAMVRALLEAGFAEMKETYGEEERDAVTVETCEVDVAVAGAAKQVVQLAEGEQSPALVALAQRLLAIGAAAAERAVTAADLRDGLEKIARGELAPEAWQVNLQRHAEPGRMSARPGFLLRIAGARATVR